MLNRQQIKQLITHQALVQEYIDLDQQLTPNGFDLTAGRIFLIDTAGCVDFDNRQRRLPEGREVPQEEISENKKGWRLSPGVYKVRTNEIINLPDDLVALAFSRTTLLRMGVFTVHGVWDAGFSGRGEFLLQVCAKEGVEILEGARLAQLVFFPVEKTQGYTGIFRGLK